MAFESKITKQAKQEIKAKHKKENTMKKAVITTVVITLVAVTAFALTFMAGMNYERGINDRVKAEAKTLTAAVTPSKQ
jgi:cell division protein FtsX